MPIILARQDAKASPPRPQNGSDTSSDSYQSNSNPSSNSKPKANPNPNPKPSSKPGSKSKPKATTKAMHHNATATEPKAEPSPTSTPASTDDSVTVASPRPDDKDVLAYQKASPREHVLMRPDTYVGSDKPTTADMWVYDPTTDAMSSKTITYTPALLKIFDEILVNAADNRMRGGPNSNAKSNSGYESSSNASSGSMSYLRVDIDAASGVIRIKNDGRGIPVDMHPKEQVYVPELIFGHMLTSSNFNDKQAKVTGGRNGYGAKLANIFSTWFTVTTHDASRGKRYTQTFRDNMTIKEPPKITASRLKTDFTQIAFLPDYGRLGMPNGLDADTLGLLRRRVLDMAGTLHVGLASGASRVRVYLDGAKLQVNSFAKYVKQYTGEAPVVHAKVGERWEVALAASPDGAFRHISFVNSIATTSGGQHVEYLVRQVIEGVRAKLQKSDKALADVCRPSLVRNHLWVFVNAQIVNPAFGSQTKEELTTRVADFGSTCKLPDSVIASCLKRCGIQDVVASTAQVKATQRANREAGLSGVKRRTVTGVPKLNDANWAGGPKSEQCTLILTEGDSALSLAVAGLAVLGRDTYGALPVRGKGLNVSKASFLKATANAEVCAIAKAMGLQLKQEGYRPDPKSLRYGSVMIMADQDYDGSHIKSLIINLFRTYWPNLLELPGFLKQFITPVVVATHSRDRSTRMFFTMPEYEAWRSAGDTDGWRIKYYKGLGTSTQAEARKYFSNLALHKVNFAALGTDPNDAERLDMVSNAKRANDRKAWLDRYRPGTHIVYDHDVTYTEFVDDELVLFGIDTGDRNLTSRMDGLTQARRKILYACFKRNLRKEIKVAQLAGYVSEKAAYHHGEASLNKSIIGMAQDFAGSNNVRLLSPVGMFGTRAMGGKDAASPRYVFTRLDPLARALFREDDDDLVTYQYEDGQRIEPQFYLPVLPLVLMNGADGVCMGWQSKVPCYNPRDVLAAVRLELDVMEYAPDAYVHAVRLEQQKQHLHNRRAILPGSVGHASASADGSASPASPTFMPALDHDHTREDGDEDVDMGVKEEDGTVQEEEEEEDDEDQQLVPWYVGFRGQIMETSPGVYDSLGTFQYEADTRTLTITELPLKTWTVDYKQWVETKLMNGPDALVDTMQEQHTGARVHFEFHLTRPVEPADIPKLFKLSMGKPLHASLVLTDEDRHIVKYNSAMAVLRDFVALRYPWYVNRKVLLVHKLEARVRDVSEVLKFMLMVTRDELVLSHKSTAQVEDELRALEFTPHGHSSFTTTNPRSDASSDVKSDPDADSDQSQDANLDAANDDDNDNDNTIRGAYKHLLSIPLGRMTNDHMARLRVQAEAAQAKLAQIQATSPLDMWRADLNTFERTWDAYEAERAEAERKAKRKPNSSTNSDARASTKRKR